MLANSMGESSCCFWECNMNSGCRFCITMVCLDFGSTYNYITCVGSWWSQWVVGAAHHCHSWWRWWWSATLWVTLTRLWLHSSICCLQFVVVEISQQCHRYAVNLSFQIKCKLYCLEKKFIFESWKSRTQFFVCLQRNAPKAQKEAPQQRKWWSIRPPDDYGIPYSSKEGIWCFVSIYTSHCAWKINLSIQSMSCGKFSSYQQV